MVAAVVAVDVNVHAVSIGVVSLSECVNNIRAVSISAVSLSECVNVHVVSIGVVSLSECVNVQTFSIGVVSLSEYYTCCIFFKLEVSMPVSYGNSFS